MKYTLLFLQVLNLGLAATTGGVYWFNLNLWKDQAFTISSLAGMVFGLITLIYLGVQFLARKELAMRLFLHALLAAPLFLGQCAALAFVLWQKTY